MRGLEARVAERTRALTEANERLRAAAAERERTRDALRQARVMEVLVEHLPPDRLGPARAGRRRGGRGAPETVESAGGA